MESLLPVLESYLRDCLDSHVVPQVSELAKRVGLSPWSFTRRFARIHSSPPGYCLKRARILIAMDLLRITDVPVSSIAESCGFSCPRSFHRAFRRDTGMTPSQYRARGGWPSGAASKRD